MKIYVIGSMQFSDQMVEVRDELKRLGHEVFLSNFVEPFLGKGPEEQEALKLEQKNNDDAIRVDCAIIPRVDAVLVLNFTKKGVAGYIGGNTFLEMGYAHILNKQVYLYNPIPENPYFDTEIIAMKPEILDGDLTKI